MESGAQFGEYRLGQRLGVGGQGEVFEATDTLGLRWALKIGHALHNDDAKALTTFAREAAWVNETFARLPRNCGILVGEHYGVYERRFYVKMRLLQGESLARRIEREGKLPESEALELARGIASAVAVAHDNDALHRDLKPENIFIEEGGQIQVLDWGCIHLIEAERVASSTTGGPTCTVGYAALEQYEPVRERLSPATDVYSLGVVLLEMLSGGNPFLGRSRSLNDSSLPHPTRTATHRPREPATVENPVHVRATAKPRLGDSTTSTTELPALSRRASLQATTGDESSFQHGESTTSEWESAGSLRVVLGRQLNFKVDEWTKAKQLDSRVVTLLQRMLEPSVERRSMTMREVLAVLDELLNACHPAHPTPTAPIGRSRSPWVAILLGAMLVGTLSIALSRRSTNAAGGLERRATMVGPEVNEATEVSQAVTATPSATSLDGSPIPPSTRPTDVSPIAKPPLAIEHRPSTTKRPAQPKTATSRGAAQPDPGPPPAYFNKR